MRIRDLALTAFVFAFTIVLGLYGKAAIDQMLYDSHAINRDDARSVAATLLTGGDHWVEFHILAEATTVRLLTNAALNSVDAPDHDLTNPRSGWRYTIEYQLLDSEREVIDSADYHFRTQIRQLQDQHTGEAIYPIFLGKSGLVSAQTRPMQLAVDTFDRRPSILRVRLKSADTGIVEVVGRSLSRIERADYSKRYTWNRLSQARRDLICKYTVYQPELLTFAERTNLLRWRWTQTPTINESEKRSLYFIGSFDDQEIRDQQLPMGLFTDPNWLATIPIPEGDGKVRLEFTLVEEIQANVGEPAGQVYVRWFGVGVNNRKDVPHALSRDMSNLVFDVSGGLVEVKSTRPVVIRAFWQASVADMATESEEIEITPVPVLSKAFVVDGQPLQYAVSHIGGQTTPLRLCLRYPFGPHFTNLQITSSTDSALANLSEVTANWEFLDDNGAKIESGAIRFTPEVSSYDNLQLVAGTEWLSEPKEVYFAVPPHAASLRITSPDCRLLATAAVRPPGMTRTTQVPEVYNAYGRDALPDRTWYGLKPPDDHRLVQANRTIILRLRPRPPQDNPEIVAGNYQWRRFLPDGNWIGRQMLVPQNSVIDVRAASAGTVFFELTPEQEHRFTAIGDSIEPLPVKVFVIGDDAPGEVRLNVNGKPLFSRTMRSARSEFGVSEVEFPATGKLSIESDDPARYFLAGRVIHGARQYLKRTAQRLDKPLVFEFQKRTADEELITMQLYRPEGQTDRYRLRVIIDPMKSHTTSVTQPGQSWTPLDRTYDLRPQNDKTSLLLGSEDRVDVGHRCFVSLGPDLPPGKYQIRIEPELAAGTAYLLMYQTTANQTTKRNIRVKAIRSSNHGT